MRLTLLAGPKLNWRPAQGVVLGILLLFADSALAPRVADSADSSQRDLLDKVLSGITENYARLNSIQAVIEKTFVDPGVTERQVITSELPGGGTITAVREPRRVQTERVLLRSPDFRCDPVDESGQTWVFHESIWTQYDSKSKQAWVRRPDQMPGLFPLDPRQFGSLEMRVELFDRLKASKVIEATQVDSPEGLPRVRILTEYAAAKGADRRLRWEFDPSRNYLPTSIVYLHDDDSINTIFEIDYQEVLPRSAWFLREATCKCFPTKGAQRGDADGWSSSFTYRTKGEVLVNKAIPDDAFEISLPPGTKVSDAVQTSAYRVGDLPAADDAALTKVGDMAPDLELTTLDGTKLRWAELKNKVVLINLFATWCGPCVAELPRLQKEIWESYRDQGLVVLAIGREESADDLIAFQRKHELTFSIVADPERKLYSAFAKQSIPRNYLIREGKITYQSMGYSTPEFDRLLKAVELELKKAKEAPSK
jgi:peroxiredoxin